MIKDHRPKEDYPPLKAQCCEPMDRSNIRSEKYVMNMEARAAKKGWRAGHCFQFGRYEIDGKRYCSRHAGMIALKMMLDK